MDINLKDRLRYDPNSGKLFWKLRPETCKRDISWNRRYAGKEAGSYHKSTGYIRIKIKSKSYAAHRIAWFLFYNEWPETIDHINGIRSDNRINNLRNVSKADNNRNLSLAKNNTSGVCGVYFSTEKNR